MDPFITVSIIVLGLVFLIDWYVFEGLKSAIKSIKKPWSDVFIIVHWIFFSLTVLTILVTLVHNYYYWPKLFRTYWLPLIFIAYLSKLFVIIFILADDIRRAAIYLSQKVMGPPTRSGIGPKISRAKFINQAGLVAGTLPFMVSIYGMAANTYNYQYRRIPLYIKDLPKAFTGMKIVQISDMHSGSLINSDPIWNVVKNINAENPDFIFFTGDLVNDRSEEILDFKDVLSQLKSEHGTFSILGNHDYGDYLPWTSKELKRENFNQLLTHQREIGWQMLNNEHFVWERNGKKLGLIGVENWSNKMRFPMYGDLSKAMKNMPETDCKFLLSHDPSHWDAEVLPDHPDIAATFAGHTHGFQFGIETANWKWSPVQYVYKRWAGLYTSEHQHLYVNRGLGFVGYPGRIGILPEISIFTLHQG